ncbi:uncharacterized protein PSFLO_00837 [Pseudozyma flocculosa]|uniref:Uncharacterized protein n=1 Tax=Pseudozyma flocculosa TaxID=84751 RepID=A0A5C3EUZ2_9BASI|nr:uncharacterized protein PSFLO_00837 [Pseudozyma flocculosa]
MASPRRSSPPPPPTPPSASAAPGMSSHVPPSFGQPGIRISYRPKQLLLGSTAAAAAAAAAASQPPSHLCPTLTVSVPPASIHHIFNHRQWRAGMLMSDALVSGAFDIAGKTVLELGAGTGLPSITAALLGTPKLVVASDYDEPAIVSELKRNVRANSPQQPHNGSAIKVCGHIWGKNVDELLDCLPTPRPALGGGAAGLVGSGLAAPRFDAILMADCLWDPLSHADLLKTLTSTLARTADARVHVIAGLHTGREKITGFLRRAHRAGLGLAPIAPPSSQPLWPSLAASTPVPNGTKVEDDALVHSAERILELEVSGNKPVASTEEDASASADVEVEEHADEPRLTGNRRLFLVDGYGPETEGDVKMRNKWLTVWNSDEPPPCYLLPSPPQQRSASGSEPAMPATMSTLLLMTGLAGRRFGGSHARMLTGWARRCVSTGSRARSALPAATVNALRHAGSRHPTLSQVARQPRPHTLARFNSTSSPQSPKTPANAKVEDPSNALAHYQGPLAGTFTRLKLFSLGSLALAGTLTPILLLAPGEVSMAGRIGLCLTALSTSGVSTALIAWIGQPYAGRMQLLAGDKGASPRIRIETVSWTLRPQVTTVFEPGFLRATSRPFATWEITNSPPPLALEGSDADAGSEAAAAAAAAAVTKVVSETVDVKTGKVVGRWVVKYDASTRTKAGDGWKMEGRCEVEGKPSRYFNVHEELLDDEWRVLG